MELLASRILQIRINRTTVIITGTLILQNRRRDRPEEMLPEFHRHGETGIASDRHELAVRVRQGDKAAREKMITSNLRLVISIAKRYIYTSNIEFQDLMQSGNLGLMKAVDRFDPDMGCKFATYATWWIKQSVTRYISDNCGTIRIPVYINDIQREISRFITQYQNEHGKEPSDKVLADRFGFTESTISTYRNVKRGVESIDAYASEDFDSDISSYLADPDVDVEDSAVQKTLSDEVNQVLGFELPRLLNF